MIKHWLISGDTHGRVIERLSQIDTKIYNPEETAVIILGDAGINFYLNNHDTANKNLINDTSFHLYLVRGNHEERPENLGAGLSWDSYVKNMVCYETSFPNIRYLIDGNEYDINGHSALVIGGAYSVDKWYRLERAGYTPDEALIANPKKCGWFKDEQLTKEEMSRIDELYAGKTYDLILSHTCPYSWQPTDLFLKGLDQSTVDNTMEKWLDDFKDKIQWNIWLWGHFHADRAERPHCEMFYQRIENLDNIFNRWQNTIIPNDIIVSPNFFVDDNKWSYERLMANYVYIKEKE